MSTLERDLENLTSKEVADMLGLDATTVRSARIARA
jgi:DNA-directed RNA polymerase specialized sigma24 family protein